MAALPDLEGKMLSEALNTVKIQVQHMKRYLVRIRHLVSTFLMCSLIIFVIAGDGTAYGCT